MPTADLNGVLRRLARGMDAAMLGQESDRLLVERALGQRDVAALQAIVHRHGAMVYRVCWRVLRHTQDTEDAFQATFLVLAQKLRTVRKHASLASWLHGVARRISVKARDQSAARHRRESRASSSGTMPPDDVTSKELLSVLDAELSRLPAKWRLPLVLCYLDGRTQEEAAKRLGWSKSTLRSRLEEARDALASRLSKRGITLATALSAVLLSDCVASAAPAPELVARAVEAVADVAAGKTLATAASAAIAALAEGAIKAMFITKLKTIAVVLVAAALVGSGIGAVSLPTLQARPTDQRDPVVQPKSALPPAAKGDPTAKLVEQLGAQEFADREAAQKELRKLGAKAETALKAGLKSENPEVRVRCAKIFTAIRKDALDDLVKNFDPKAENVPDHPLWNRFKAIASDSRASRELFARIIADARLARVLDAAEAVPADRVRIYRDEVAWQSCNALFVVAGETVGGHNMLLGGPKASELKPPPEPVTSVSLAAYFFLGSYSETAVEVAGKDRAGRPIREGEIVETFEFSQGNTPVRPVMWKLFAAWLDNRVDRDTLESGYWRATMNAIPDAASAARRLLAAEMLPSPAKAYAAIYLARVGKRADSALMTPLLDDATVARAVIYDKPAPVQVRDAALAACLLLHDENPADYGFDVLRKRGSPKADAFDMAWLGFWSDDTRTATHKKAKEWLDTQEKKDEKKEPKPDPIPAKLVEQLGSKDFAERESAQKQLQELGSKARGAIEAGLKFENREVVRRCRELLDRLARAEFDAKHWARFAKVIGDDNESRALFERIRSLRRNIELLDAVAADPKAAGKLYDDRWAELNKTARIPTGVGSYQLVPAPLADVVGWMYLGTFPGAEGTFHTSHSLDFLPHGKHSGDALTPTLKDETVAAPLRRLVGKWTAARVDYSGREYGFQLALWCDIKEVLPAARETVVANVKDDPYPGNTARNVGFALLVVGKFGSKDDLPLLEKHAASDVRCAVILHDPPPKAGVPVHRIIRMPIEGQDTTTQLRDVSATMRLHLLGQNPDDSGFYWRWPNDPDARKPVKPAERFELYSIGFMRDADRATAHKKAKEWVNKQEKKDAPKK
ncbi:MAG: RNA polymerase sigma factor [Gemmataceae bacterium]